MQKGPLYRGSKLQKLTFLISPEELSALFIRLKKSCSSLHFLSLGTLLDEPNAETTELAYTEAYRHFYEACKSGKFDVASASSRGLNRSLVFSLDSCILEKTPSDKYLAKLQEPGVHFRITKVSFSPELGKLHLGALGSEALIFGLEASYPQLIQKVGQGVENALLPPFMNGALFKEIRRALRTIATPAKFLFKGRTLFSELRVSKSASWILDQMESKWPALKPQGEV